MSKIIDNTINFINIENIDETLVPNIASYLQEYIKLNLTKEYIENFIVFKFAPTTPEEIQALFDLDKALKQANYTSSILSLLDNNKDTTPYYLRVEWPMAKQEN